MKITQNNISYYNINMGFFSRLGNKVSSGLHSAARLGKKVLGSVSSVGNRIADSTERVLNTVNRVPILGQVVAPITGVVRSGVGLVRDVADASKQAQGLIQSGEDLLQGKGSLKDVVASGKSQLERARNIKRDASSVVQDAKALKSDMSKSAIKSRVLRR